jgi:O-antigen/teichoic acid export membrane protein
MKLIDLAKDYYKAFMANELSNRFLNLLSVDVLIKASGLALMYVYLRLMNLEEYGIFGMVVNLVGSVALFMTFGLYIAQTTYFHEYKDNIGKLIFNVNLILFVFLIILYLVFFYTLVDFNLLNFLIGKDIKNFSLVRFRLWIWVGITTQVFVFMMNNYFVMSKRKIRVLQIYNASKIIITNGLTIWALYQVDLDKAYVRLKYSVIVDAFITLPFFFSYIRTIKPEVDFKLIRKCLLIGLPSMATGIIGSIYGLTDRKILLDFTSAATLGVYTYALVLTGNLWIFLQAFLSAFWPTFLDEKDTRASFRKTLRVTKKVMLLLIIISIGMFSFAWFVDYFKIINLKYKESIGFMPLMLVTQLVIAFSTIMSNYFIYFKMTYIQIFTSIISLSINWALCIWLIPQYSCWGAIWATLITATVSCAFNYGYAYYMCLVRRPLPTSPKERS